WHMSCVLWKCLSLACLLLALCSNPRSQPDELFLFPYPNTFLHDLVNWGECKRSPLACQPVFELFFELFLATSFTLLTTREGTTIPGKVTQNRAFLTIKEWPAITEGLRGISTVALDCRRG